MPPFILTMLRRCLACEKGATLPLVGLIFLALMSAIGLAVDYGRAQMVQSKMQAATDAAALAAASVANSSGLSETARYTTKLREANKYLEANFPVQGADGSAMGYMQTLYPEGADQYITNMQVNSAANDNTLSLTAEGRVETAIMRIIGVRTMDVSAYTEIAIDNTGHGLEVVLVLDNTGSMNYGVSGETRYQALKKAASALVDDIYDDFERDMTFIGIVPYGNQVNVGAAKQAGSAWLRSSPASSTAVTGPVTCLYADSLTAYPPSRSMSYFKTVQRPTSDIPDSLFYNAAVQPNCDGVVEMLAMTNSTQALKDKINSLSSKLDMTTRIDIGAIWGWRMLDQGWRGYWSHVSAALPLDYGTRNTNKVAIILTDGENTPPSGVDADGNLAEICTLMKSRGIIVYTVTLHSTAAIPLMRNCATSPTQHYFHVPPGGSLSEAFAQIANSLANLRISR